MSQIYLQLSASQAIYMCKMINLHGKLLNESHIVD